MQEVFKKPYEISVWEDVLIPATEGKSSYYKEKKIAVIGSDKMDSPNRVYDAVLKKNINGEVSLTFSLAYKYFDSGVGDVTVNPFANYLINERKIKLYYDGEWYDFVIKECEEDSDSMVFTYTARSLFVQELSKVGYNIVLDRELNNNQGTAVELARKAVEGTDWVVADSDLLQQYVREPLYQVTAEAFEALDLETSNKVQIAAGETLYVFYSYIANKDGTYLRFMREVDRQADKFTEDSNGAWKGPNYRIVEFVPEVDDNSIDGVGTINGIYASHQGYRLVYKQSTTYDPVMKRTVDRYQATFGNSDTQEIYKYTDYEYTTSDIVSSFVTNGSNFNIYEDGSLQGWRAGLGDTHLDNIDVPILQVTIPSWSGSSSFTGIEKTAALIGETCYFTFELKGKEYIGTATLEENSENSEYKEEIYVDGEKCATISDNGDNYWRITTASVDYQPYTLKSVYYKGENPDSIPDLAPLDLTTYPEISTTTNVVKITNFAKINGYLETKLDTDQYIFNSGFEDNCSTVQRIVKGESYLLRVRGGYSNTKHGDLTNFTNGSCVRAAVAKYENYTPENGYYYNDKLITNVQTKRILENGIILDFNGEFTVKNNTVSNGVFDEDHKTYRVDTVVQEPSARYIYIDTEDSDGAEYVWDSDNQVYILKEDADFFMDYLYTTAVAQQAVSTDEFKTGEANVGIFIRVDDDLEGKWIYINDIQITRLYFDETDEPVLIGNTPVARSISTDYYYLKPAANSSAEQINQYHTLEDLQEELGATSIIPLYNEDCEKILSVSESKSNCFNILQSICETFECWLELRVYHDKEGYLKTNSDGAPIKQVVLREYAGKDNYAGFKYGINLDQIQRNIVSDEFVTKLIVENTASDYTKSGSLSIQDAPSNPSLESYIFDFSYYQNKKLIKNVDESNIDLYNFYRKMHDANQAYQEAQKNFVELEASLTKVKSKRTVYSELIDKASDDIIKARKKFIDLTNMDYDDYVEQQTADSKIEDQNVADTIAKLYACSSTINNYSGVLQNLNQEYHDLMIKAYGAREYSLVITTVLPTRIGEWGSTKVILNDYLDNVQFTVFTDETAEQGISGPNERIFKYNRVYESIRIDGLPTGYYILYFDGVSERRVKTGTVFSIKGIDSGRTTRLRLVPPATNELSAQEKANQLLKEKEAIEAGFYKSYSRFIQEGTWSSTNYIDPELYYLDALQVSRVSAQPKISYTIKVLEVSEIEGLQNYNFDVGDKTYIEDVEFFGYIIEDDESSENIIEDGDSNEDYILTPVREEVIVSEAEWHLDQPDENSITVQNYKDQFEDLFQRLTATVQSVQYNEPAYSRMASKLDSNGLINSSTLISSLNGIAGQAFNLSKDGNVSVNDGILMRSLTGGNKQVKIDSEGIAISEDAGQSWTYVVNSAGLNTDKMTTGQLNTQQIDILDGANPSFRWDKNGISAYSPNENGGADSPYDLKTFVRFDKYGLYGIQNNEDFVASSLDQIKEDANFGITWDGFFIKNKYRDAYVSISSEDDFQIVGNTTANFVIGSITKTAVFEEEGEES